MPYSSILTQGSSRKEVSFGSYNRPSKLELDRTVAFRKGMIIQGHHYLVEISYNLRGLFISLFSMSDPLNRNQVLEIENPSKVQEIMEAFDFNYERLAQHVKVVKNQIKIRKPDSEEATQRTERAYIDFRTPLKAEGL